MNRSAWPLAAVALAAVLSGCSTSGGDVKKVVVALTLDKEPLTDADVVLMPKDDPELGDGCSGQTASDGKVELKPNPKKPLHPGRYVLLVKKLVRPDGTPFKLEEDIAVRPESGGGTMGMRNLVPTAYSEPSRALLIVEVVSGETKASFDLDSRKK
jgi:hypothetical protein